MTPYNISTEWLYIPLAVLSILLSVELLKSIAIKSSCSLVFCIHLPDVMVPAQLFAAIGVWLVAQPKWLKCHHWLLHVSLCSSSGMLASQLRSCSVQWVARAFHTAVFMYTGCDEASVRHCIYCVRRTAVVFSQHHRRVHRKFHYNHAQQQLLHEV